MKIQIRRNTQKFDFSKIKYILRVNRKLRLKFLKILIFSQKIKILGYKFSTLIQKSC